MASNLKEVGIAFFFFFPLNFFLLFIGLSLVAQMVKNLPEVQETWV